MLPGAAFVWWRQGGLPAVLAQVLIIVVTQVALAAPFLASYPKEYLSRAFDFGRQFDFTWTVNWRFVGKDVFLSQPFSALLLAVHLALLALLGLVLWPKLSQSSAWAIIKGGLMPANKQHVSRPSAEEIVAVVFTSNFVGVVCARSLHYQFYSWYFHMLPHLLHLAQLRPAALIAIWLAIEYAWNVYPSTVFSSLTLLAAHLSLLTAVVARLLSLNAKSKAKTA
ncbi:dolichyl-P-Man:Man(5)GlcNAc(2)-PP-dolichol alpha-1,3-mannosyltransferase [Coemansia sp. RSA 486]|nr:dolichyl-P-Man:Man(5)GlcNAc(2)-PP-dolichol alpha-1,3-mannosyltransferase [Coemansia sp. RSA 486]